MWIRVAYMAVLFACIAPLCAQSRRALVIGINAYQTRPHEQEPVGETADSQSSTSSASVGRGTWANLDGAVPDALLFRQLLLDRYGFPPQDVVFLVDKEAAKAPSEVATGKRILEVFDKHLIEAARPGDISVFYYAGHGSRVRNLKTEEPDGLDETFVPADSEDGAPDIRDKELARLYRKAAEKGVVLTVIADSCHSGGVSRGVGPLPKTRKLADDPREISDPPDTDPATGKPLPYPTELGVLVIAAAQDDQTAEEMYADGRPHGVFTTFFSKAILGAPVDEPVSSLFARTIALMRAEGRMQLPAVAGQGRLESTLFGQAASATEGITVPVLEARSNGTVTLRGGVALGLQEGVELVGRGDSKTRIRIEGQPTLANATARVIDGVPAKAGDVFRIDRWVVAPDLRTRFYLPASDSPSKSQLQDLLKTVQEVTRERSMRLINDPTASKPSNVLRLSGETWQLESRTDQDQNVSHTNLGAWPTRDSLGKALTADAQDLFVDFPPPPELTDGVRQETAGLADAVQFVDSREEASYQLVGAAQGGRLSYSWVLANAGGAAAEGLPVPVRTEWIALDEPRGAARLRQFALNITRLRLWLNIEVPGGATNEFPYSLALKKIDTGEARTSGVLVEDEAYSVVLQTTKERLASAGASATPRWVYVLSIDRSGGMQPIFPRGENSSENRVPRGGEGPEEIVLLKEIVVSEPFGVDTMILLASEEPVDPFALRIDPVRTRGPEGARGAPGTLSAFLFQLQGGARGFSSAAPTNWSITRITFQTVARQTAAATGR